MLVVLEGFGMGLFFLACFSFFCESVVLFK